ncbi:MAG: hypothetical protein NZ518_11260, partial [Dehalococcoidia bacterium]|nr:hypothetical protein [Dehalococcoidia bacterium]
MKAGSGISAQTDWRAALDEALNAAINELGDAPPSAVLVFVAFDWAPHFGDMLAAVAARTGAPVVAGCSGQAVIGRGREVEGQPAVSVLALSVPPDSVTPVRLSSDDVAALELPADVLRRTGVAA